MSYSSIIFGLIFLITGFLFALGKLHVHLKAWKMMPDDEKNKIRIKELCRNLGEVIMLSGIIFLINGFVPEGKSHWFLIAMIAWLVVAGVDLLYIQKSKKYEKNGGKKNEEHGK